MPSVSKCPRCNQEVTIPDGLDKQASVQCPHCLASYPIDDALAAGPPSLIPVDGKSGEGIKSDSEYLLKSDLGEGSYHTPDTGSATDSPTESPSDGSLREPAGIDAWQKVDETPQIDAGDTVGPSDKVDTGAFAGFAEEDPDAPGKLGVSPGAKPRRKKKQKSMARETVGAIVGGFLGLSIGYYGLNYFGGERFDFLDIYLPGVAHTEKHKPGPAADEPGAANDEPPPAENSPESPPEPAEDPDRMAQPDPPPVASPDVSPPDSSSDPTQEEPQPAPLPEGYVGLREPPSFTSDELGQALKAASDLVATVGDLDQLPVEAVEELRRLGRVITFIEDDSTDGRLWNRKEAVRRILQQLADGPGRIDEIGRLAGRLLEQEEFAEPGIILAGSVRTVKKSDQGLHGMTMQLAVQPDPISVLSDKPLPFESGDQVVVLGSIVTNPAENVVGYGGSKPNVIWLGMAVKARR